MAAEMIGIQPTFTHKAGMRAGAYGNLTTQRDRNQALIRRCGEDTGARRLAPRLGG